MAAAAGAQATIDAKRWLQSSSSFFGIRVGAPGRPPDVDIPLQNNIPTIHDSSTSIQEQQPKTKTKQQQDYEDCDLTLLDCITALVHKFPVVVLSKHPGAATATRPLKHSHWKVSEMVTLSAIWYMVAE